MVVVNQRKGISLIILVITIVVIIILAVAVLLNVIKNNPVENAKESTSKNDIKTFNEQLMLYVSNKTLSNDGQYDKKKLNATKNELYERWRKN